jgi:hypothetical protein
LLPSAQRGFLPEQEQEYYEKEECNLPYRLMREKYRMKKLNSERG